jgi:hypothetical protein
MKLETILLLVGTGLTVYMFLRYRSAAAATPAASGTTSTTGVSVTMGNSAYDGVSIGREYLDNLYRLAYADGANGP